MKYEIISYTGSIEEANRILRYVKDDVNKLLASGWALHGELNVSSGPSSSGPYTAFTASQALVSEESYEPIKSGGIIVGSYR